MSTLLWNKAGVHTDTTIMKYLAGEDIVLDRQLFVYDIRATIAHTRGLGLRDLISKEDASQIISSLNDLDALWAKGQFVLDERYEDGHSAIEAFLTEQLGELGGRVHLGRSRNDQVLVATRLYMIDVLETLKNKLIGCAKAALNRAREHETDPMPGYTHLQRAVPSSIGLWMGSFAESFVDSAEMVGMTRNWIDACPLGTAAGYGVNLPLPREEVAKELGFTRLLMNPMAAQASRGKHEHQVVSVMWQGMQDARRLAWDLSLFSTAEFNFVQMPRETTTGSSIMPNKRNPDLIEFIRASCAAVGACITELQQLQSLPSGYHRDLQLTKPVLLRATRITLDTISLIPRLIECTQFNTVAMRKAIDPSMMATDMAIDLAASGASFREAYRSVGESLDQFERADPSASISARVSPGGCGNLQLDQIQHRINAV